MLYFKDKCRVPLTIKNLDVFKASLKFLHLFSKNLITSLKEFLWAYRFLLFKVHFKDSTSFFSFLWAANLSSFQNFLFLIKLVYNNLQNFIYLLTIIVYIHLCLLCIVFIRTGKMTDFQWLYDILLPYFKRFKGNI